MAHLIETFLKVHSVDMHEYLDNWFMKNLNTQTTPRSDSVLGDLSGVPSKRRKIAAGANTTAFLRSVIDRVPMLVLPSERGIPKVSRLAGSLMARNGRGKAA